EQGERPGSRIGECRWKPCFPVAQEDRMSWLDSNLTSALLGAIVGSLLSAVPAYLLAIRASRETLKLNQVSRDEQRKASTFRALVKLVIVINRIGSLHRHIEGSISQAEKMGPASLKLWQKLEPMTGFAEDAVRFDADDLVAFVAADEFSFVTDLL